MTKAEFDRAAADIDVENGLMLLTGKGDGAGPVGGHQGFEIMPGRGANKLAGFLSKQIGDGAGVIPLERFTRQNDRAGIDVFRGELGFLKGIAKELFKLVGIDCVIGAIGRQQDGGPPQNLTVYHDEPARQAFRKTLQMHLGEHQMGGRRANIDTDGGELDVILFPDCICQILLLFRRHTDMFKA